MRMFQRIQNLFHARLDFCVRQRTLDRAKREPKREADAPFRHALALIPVKFPDRHKRFWCGRTDSATNRFRGQGLVDDDRDVARDGRVAGQRMHRQRRGGSRGRQRVEVELGHVDVLRRR